MATPGGPVTATGHVVGRTYLSRLEGQPYTVEAAATLWECAPAGAVRVRWENGNSTLRTEPRGADLEQCGSCGEFVAPSSAHVCSVVRQDAAVA
jgi:hypothetical protein